MDTKSLIFSVLRFKDSNTYMKLVDSNKLEFQFDEYIFMEYQRGRDITSAIPLRRKLDILSKHAI